ncbi:L-dopachrome tautomerase yellow-k [Haematobia irritans]|uniref:L-dopachrome tautomerase yellow-k n=1 Tax=Haematobia irritans TaxID=7368 RepID=UPI003F502FB2
MVSIGSVLCILCCFGRSWAWLLAQCGLNESYRVLHLSTHFAKVFLSITVESKTFPTLIETQWPDNYLSSLSPILYPHRDSHANGLHKECGLIQQATWSQVDSLSRLWVMDIGWPGYNETDKFKCNPKLLVFDLIRNNMEVLRIDCGRYIRSDGLSKVLDIGLGPRVSPCGSEKFIYFVLSDDSQLYAYDILEQKWHSKLLKSKKYSTIREFLPIKPRDLTFSMHGDIIISDEDGNLYTAPNVFHNSTLLYTDTIEMHLVGTLLGPTRGLMVDPYGVLFYVVTKFGAVVRCEYMEHITTEDSEIIHMTSKNIQQIFFGSGGSVWLLSDRWLKPQDQCTSGY